TIRSILETSRLDRIFWIFPDVDAALAANAAWFTSLDRTYRRFKQKEFSWRRQFGRRILHFTPKGSRSHDCEILRNRWICWEHAIDSTATPVPIDGVRDFGKGGVHESRRVGERSSGLRNHH